MIVDTRKMYLQGNVKEYKQIQKLGKKIVFTHRFGKEYNLSYYPRYELLVSCPVT